MGQEKGAAVTGFWASRVYSVTSPKGKRKMHINQEGREEREEAWRGERRESKKGVDGVVEEDQQGLGNWNHKSDEVYLSFLGKWI